MRSLHSVSSGVLKKFDGQTMHMSDIITYTMTLISCMISYTFYRGPEELRKVNDLKEFEEMPMEDKVQAFLCVLILSICQNIGSWAHIEVGGLLKTIRIVEYVAHLPSCPFEGLRKLEQAKVLELKAVQLPDNTETLFIIINISEFTNLLERNGFGEQE